MKAEHAYELGIVAGCDGGMSFDDAFKIVDVPGMTTELLQAFRDGYNDAWRVGIDRD